MDLERLADIVDLLHIDDFKVGDRVRVKDSQHERCLEIGEVIDFSDGYFKVKFDKDQTIEWFRWKAISPTYTVDLLEDIGTTNWWPAALSSEPENDNYK